MIISLLYPMDYLHECNDGLTITVVRLLIKVRKMIGCQEIFIFYDCTLCMSV